MNGAHDLGGMMGFGPINPEPNEPVFHHPWEAQMFGVEFLFGGDGFPLDAKRHQHEKIPPPRYLNLSYYQKWLTSLETRVLQSGVVTAAELASGINASGLAPDSDPLPAADTLSVIMARYPYTRPAEVAARFAEGDQVTTRNIHPTGHTRLPRYARGRVGTVERVNGYMVFPDSNAHGKGEDPHWCYSVVFEGRALWGPDADPTLRVSLDLWEPYFEIE